jgi:type IV pilus assembly protein PilA
MLARLHKAMENRDEGFTLIELLVVIIIIGILAAIAIPVFLNQRKKGYDAASKSELKSIATSEESYATANNGAYTKDVDALKAEGYNQSSPYTGTTNLTISALGDAWCADVANSADTSVQWGQSSTTGVAAKGTCADGVFS